MADAENQESMKYVWKDREYDIKPTHPLISHVWAYHCAEFVLETQEKYGPEFRIMFENTQQRKEWLENELLKTPTPLWLEELCKMLALEEEESQPKP